VTTILNLERKFYKYVLWIGRITIFVVPTRSVVVFVSVEVVGMTFPSASLVHTNLEENFIVFVVWMRLWFDKIK